MNVRIPPDKIAAYLQTDYRIDANPAIPAIGGAGIVLRIHEYSDAVLHRFADAACACGVFITACNPLGTLQRAEDNAAAMRLLKADLDALSPWVLPGAGVDPTGAWPAEPSYFALGVDRDEAKQLGLRHRQDAIVWVGADGVPELVLLR